MVAAEKILQVAKEENVDIIGLSGLITPSLEEMIHVAKEMERQNFKVPLLIGGATTSKIHAAVKIDPGYTSPVIHVRDASRAVGITSSLVSKDLAEPYINKVKKEYSKLREKYYSNLEDKNYLSLEDARNNALKLDWNNQTYYKPQFTGIRKFEDYSLEEISKYIDWTFFFHAWKLNGKYPEIFEDPIKGEEAKKLYQDAQELLAKIIENKMLEAKGVIGFFPANSNGDDIILYKDEQKTDILETLNFLRNQEEKQNDYPNLCLSDFITPKTSGKEDYIGTFAVTTGINLEKWTSKFEQDLDDYSSIMMKILADRLAEAYAELIHVNVRKKYWGYAPNEDLTLPSILKEEYQGIRPAPGYPACPEHSEKKKIFDIMDVESLGITLTENFAMYPAASVSGYYFANKNTQYFNVGKISKDQVKDYAKRKTTSVSEIERLLNANLNYK
jgi:5-methyltetrahydrofolate--homocysteine methyltransferase